MEIDEKDLLQANATIIAGILILLTISTTIPDQSSLLASALGKLIFFLAITPFMGAIYTLLDTRWGNPALRMSWCKGFTMFGLVCLLGAIAIVLFTPPSTQSPE